jgi:hypothetical protein
MEGAPDPKRPIALQKEIQRAGATSGLIRSVLQFGGFAPWALLLLGFPLGLAVAFLTAPFGLAIETAGWIWAASIGLALFWRLGSVVATPAAAAYRRLRQEQLRRKLARLPREQLAQVLLPLKGYSYPDTRQLVEPLIRELRPEGTEVLPSASPEGSGSEIAPPLAAEGSPLPDAPAR